MIHDISYNPEKLNEMLTIIKNGLPKSNNRKTITIIGAGMAGLSAASLLKAAGHTVNLIESSNRLGGRVFTERNAFTNGLYLDMGAMRIPSSHLLVLEYLKKYNLPINPFINSTPQDPIFVNGVRTRLKDFKLDPDMLRFPVLPDEKGKTGKELFRYSVDPFIKLMENTSLEEKKKILAELDRYSFQNYLLYNPFNRSLSSNAIDLVGTMAGITGFPELSFLQIFFDVYEVISNSNTKLYEITGGMDRLPYAFFPEVKDIIHFNEPVTVIVPSDKRVTVYTRKGSLQKAYTSDYLLTTVPFPAMQYIRIDPYDYFSYKKRVAIRNLHYTTSTKIGLEFTHRFWEKEGIFGGQFVTDTPIGLGYYPSHNLGSSGPAVLLASYTWEDDTLIWDCLPPNKRITKALENLELVHGKQVYQYFITGASKSWARDDCIGGGDFCVLKPNQRLTFGDVVASPEGRVHFAGEHTSNHRGWIEGAIESGIRAAMEIHESPGNGNGAGSS